MESLVLKQYLISRCMSCDHAFVIVSAGGEESVPFCHEVEKGQTASTFKRAISVFRDMGSAMACPRWGGEGPESLRIAFFCSSIFPSDVPANVSWQSKPESIQQVQ